MTPGRRSLHASLVAIRGRRGGIDPASIGHLLGTWRVDAGFSLDDAAMEIRGVARELGFSVSRELIQFYEAGSFSAERVNLLFLVAASTVYGHNAAELGPAIERRMSTLLRLATFGAPSSLAGSSR